MSAALAPSVLGSFASRRLLVALSVASALALSAFTVRAISGACADALGDRIGSALAGALGPVSSALPPAPADDTWTDLELSAPSPATRVLAAVPAQRARGAKRGSPPSALRAIRISSAQVLALAAHRAVPDAAPVRANAEHPAGLQLRGVSALGVGLRDGDVLTEAAGQRASSVATVVGVVLAARSRRSAEISGRFYRSGMPYLVTVEQPYPPGT